MMYRVLSAFAIAAAIVSGAAGGDQKQQPQAIDLFDGRSLQGWTYFLVDPKAKMEDVWRVEDGILICKGQPMGYLATQRSFTNFKLIVEWRWPPGKKPGNSGVLMRIHGDTQQMLPKCVEAQLKSGNAGDIWAFQGFQIGGPRDRLNARPERKILGLPRVADAEHAPGQWNRYEITLKDDELVLVINGKEVNRATGVERASGPIALQSEGAEIHFRKVRIIPLD